MISIAILLVTAAALSAALIHAATDESGKAATREDVGLMRDNGTYGAAPSVTMYPVTGGKVSIEDNRTNLIHFMYLEHLGGSAVEIADENRAQFDILRDLHERYGGENLSIFTIMIPSCCLPPYDTFLHLVYDGDAVKWPVIIDDDYGLYMAFEDHLSADWELLGKDPTLIFIDRYGSVVSVTGHLELEATARILDDLIYRE